MTEMGIQTMAGGIQGLVQELVQRLRPQRILLFGSYASGSPNAASDLDLLVVVQETPGWREAYRLKTELQSQLPVPLQLVFIKEEEFEETKDVVGGLAYPASHAGKVLYDKNA